tara:strand:- start:39412 stop:40131 length:720 start_codon:yes stop_codon:yes gene_type:complete
MKEVIYSIFYFPLPILWFLLITMFLVNVKKRITIFKIVILIFYISLTPLFANIAEYPLTRGDNFDYDNEKYSAVLVPTAGIYKDVNFSWHPSSNSVLRVKLGEKMAKKYNLPLIISGGKIELSGKSEAETVEKIINYNNVILETYSRNSYQTSKNMTDVYNKNKLNKELSILLVTSAKHSLRMSLALEKKGFKVKKYIIQNQYIINFNSFLPDARTININNASLYEYIGIIFYFLKGYI